MRVFLRWMKVLGLVRWFGWWGRFANRAGIPCEGRFAPSRPLTLCEGEGAAFVHLATPRPSLLFSAYLLDVWATRPPPRAGIRCEGRFARSRPLALCEGEGPLCPSDISPAERGQPYPLVAVLQWSHGGERGFCPALPQWLDVQSAGFPRPRE